MIGEVLRMSLPRTWVNKGKKEGRSIPRPFSLRETFAYWATRLAVPRG